MIFLRKREEFLLPSLSVSVPKSTTFIGAKVWNSLPDKLRSTKTLKEFKKAVRELHL